MKGAKKLHELQSPEEARKCCICLKTISAPYGRWRNGDWTCSKTCENDREIIQADFYQRR